MDTFKFSNNINLALRLQDELAKPHNTQLRKESISAERVGRLLGRGPLGVTVERVAKDKNSPNVYETGSVKRLNLRRRSTGSYFS